MNKVLLIDTNFSSIPIYNYLAREKFEVFVIGNNPNDYLAKISDNYINIDYRNINDVKKIINTIGINFIVPGCNDVSYQVCAELNKHNAYYGIDDVSVTQIINNKKCFREFAHNNNLPVPRPVEDYKNSKIWPLIVKPVDAFSGKGITIVHKNERDSFDSAIEKAKNVSKSKSFIIEQFIDGQLYSHSAFISNGKIIIDFIVEEHCISYPYAVDTSHVIYDFSKKMLTKIRNCIHTIIKKLNLVDGLIHSQFIMCKNNFIFIEITRRCPGDLYSLLIQNSSNLSYAEIYSSYFVNKNVHIDKKKLKNYYVMRHTISEPNETILNSIQFNFPVQVEKFIPLKIAGDTIEMSPVGRVGILFIKSDSEKQFKYIFEQTLCRNLYTLKQE